ncbi:hypothetical protein P3T25_005311 [Paraburkholderia sp. GAS32]|jgi:hypothetical protein
MGNRRTRRPPHAGWFQPAVSLLLLPETVTVGASCLGVAPGQLREPGQAQQESDCCIGGHLLVPYEQYTQQSPGFGLTTALQCSHS